MSTTRSSKDTLHTSYSRWMNSLEIYAIGLQLHLNNSTIFVQNIWSGIFLILAILLIKCNTVLHAFAVLVLDVEYLRYLKKVLHLQYLQYFEQVLCPSLRVYNDKSFVWKWVATIYLVCLQLVCLQLLTTGSRITLSHSYICVNISERKSGTERTKKRKKRELLFFHHQGAQLVL